MSDQPLEITPAPTSKHYSNVLVKWVDTAPNILNYTIQWSDQQGVWPNSKTVAGTEVTLSLHRRITYYFRVNANLASSSSPFSPVVPYHVP